MLKHAAGWLARLRQGSGGPGRHEAQAHIRARAHFRRALPEGRLPAQDYVVFDLETTGLSPSAGDAIVSIGAVRVRAAAPDEAETFSTLVDPGRPIPALATRYHGITAAHVAGAPSVAQAVAAFQAFAGEAVLVAHNAAFDMACLHAAEFAGAPATPNPALCSLVLSQWLDPQEADHGLDAVAARMGEIIRGRHDALGDAMATARIFCRLLARADARGIDHLDELYRRTGMWRQLIAGAENF
jgi:DNA polymerase III epsilon subunit-like protein